MNPKAAVEAALFSAAGNLRISEIAEKTGITEEEGRTALLIRIPEGDAALYRLRFVTGEVRFP